MPLRAAVLDPRINLIHGDFHCSPGAHKKKTLIKQEKTLNKRTKNSYQTSKDSYIMTKNSYARLNRLIT